MVRKGHGGFPRLGAKSSLCYELFGRTGSEGFPGAKNKFVVQRSSLMCSFELATTQAMDLPPLPAG
jgi:hypothetical protein